VDTECPGLLESGIFFDRPCFSLAGNDFDAINFARRSEQAAKAPENPLKPGQKCQEDVRKSRAGIVILSLGIALPALRIAILAFGIAIPVAGIAIPTLGIGVPSLGIAIPSFGIGFPAFGNAHAVHNAEKFRRA
jgi:hypothetical protein